LELPKISGDDHSDYGYAWLLLMEGRRALVFYYHGLSRARIPIWVFETGI